MAAILGTVRAMGAGWFGKGWEVCGTQGKMKEPRIEKLVSLGMVISEARWKGFGREEVVGGWLRDEEAQTSFEISLRKKR